MDSSCSSTSKEVAHNIFPYLIQFTDGTIQRLAGTEQTPPGVDPLTGVISKDIILSPETGLSARIYRPKITTNDKLPLVIYFHGGAFLIATPSEPLYHRFCNSLASCSRAMVVSVDYHLAPEHSLPAAYDDAWAATHWVAAHASRQGPEEWLNDWVDFNSIFLVGDSAGATLSHHAACLVGLSDRVNFIQGIAHIHPYFWGKEPLGSELSDPSRKAMVDKWWGYVCPSDKGSDDPLINPFADGAPSLDRVECERMLVMVAEKDILRDRGRLYYDAMVKKKRVEYFETLGEDHVFFLFDPDCDKAKELISKLASFIING